MYIEQIMSAFLLYFFSYVDIKLDSFFFLFSFFRVVALACNPSGHG